MYVYSDSLVLLIRKGEELYFKKVFCLIYLLEIEDFFLLLLNKNLI